MALNGQWVNGYRGVGVTAYIHKTVAFVIHIQSQLASSAVPLTGALLLLQVQYLLRRLDNE